MAIKEKKPNKSIQTLEFILNELPLDVYTEFQFHPKRKFRADYFIPIGKKGILIEYNGLNYRNANKNGHQSASGIVKDNEKINLALELGYITLQYNNESLKDPEKVKNQILKMIQIYSKWNVT